MKRPRRRRLRLAYPVAMLFDVYGRYRVRVDAGGTAWLLGTDGTSREIEGLAIPPDAGADEIVDLLDVAFHEASKPGDTVRIIPEGSSS